MKNRFILIIWISMVMIGFTIGMTFPKAEASQGSMVELLMQILEEEQKQTALLDQISCYGFHNTIMGGVWSNRQITDICGKPLNYTGVWTP